MADYHDLLHDIILLILTMLPVKSLLRFKCVSKSWNLLISSQDFAKMHVNQSLIHPKPLGLIWKVELMTKVRLHIFAVDCSKLDNSAETIQRLHHPLEGRAEELTLVGSSNGLLCVTCLSRKGYYKYEESFFVFNPLTRKGSNISGEANWLPSRSHYYGFGYDDAHDDYKVVTWNVLPEQFPPSSDYCSKFDVYSVKNGSWSTRNSRLTLSYTKGISCGVLVNCVVHWIWGRSESRYNIVAFDLRTDEDKLMETPENHLANHWRMDLGVLKGCLCGIVFYGHTQNKLDLWIMKEYGLKDSWTKMTIDLPLQHLFAWVVQTKLGRMTPIVPIVQVNKKRMILYSYVQGFLLCDITSNQLSKIIRIREFCPKEYVRVPEKFSFVPKEFRFEGSLVQLLGFDSFDSLWDEQVVQHEQVVAEPNKRKEKKE